MGKLQEDLGDIRAQLEKIASGASPINKPTPDLVTADAPHINVGQSDDSHGHIGHRGALLLRVSASEGSILITPVPANGMFRTPFPPPPPLELGGSTLVENRAFVPVRKGL